VRLKSIGDVEVIEPHIEICDAHHHLWHLQDPPEMLPGVALTYLLPDYLKDINSGHAVRNSVFIDSSAFYRADGDPRLRYAGETEFANGIAAMSASGRYGDSRVCSAIVGRINLSRSQGEIEQLIDAHLAAGGGRFRGVRLSAAYDPTGSVVMKSKQAPPNICVSPGIRNGLKQLSQRGLSLDVWVYHEQIHEVVDLADANPDLRIVLNHLGTPLGVGAFVGKARDVYVRWRGQMETLAQRPNCFVKVGGLGLPFCNLKAVPLHGETASEALAEKWRVFVEVSIELFGPERCMFESNFPADGGCCDFRTLWNTYKRLTRNYSDSEKNRMYFDTAREFYRIASR